MKKQHIALSTCLLAAACLQGYAENTMHQTISEDGLPLTWHAFLESRHTELALRAGSLDIQAQYEGGLAHTAITNGSLQQYMEGTNGVQTELVAIHDGQPVYYSTHALGAADTIHADELWPGGGTSLNLSGSNTTVGVWDSNEVRGSHVEFGGRTAEMDDSAPHTVHPHPTQVAGTMVAAGVNASAKGMAFEANLSAYDWDADLFEMAQAAGSDDLRISNHSYGQTLGWEVEQIGASLYWVWHGDTAVSGQEDYKFGFYNSNHAREIDGIAYDAQTYLPVWSAGNERDWQDGGPSEQPVWHYVFNGTSYLLSNQFHDPDGGATGHDTIHPHGTAKNILTVGAIRKIPGGWQAPGDATLTYFSSVGPTDDGRIKPDLVAPGKSIYTTHNAANDGYAIVSGTSFSAPTVAGSLDLIAQHHNQLAGTNHTLLASTLRGIAIHTAGDEGTTGPDYSFGWGVFRAEKAAALVSSNHTWAGNQGIKEFYIPDGDWVEFTVAATNTAPLKVTVCWTDPAGPILADSLDPTNLTLINDLDLRLVSPSGTTNAPWVLDPSAPATAATLGDNFRDNTEQVLVETPENGDYTVILTHKDTLKDGWQTASMMLSGFVPQTGLPLVIEGLDVAAGTNTIHWTAIPGGFYRVQGKGDLVYGGSWSDLTGDFSILRTNVVVEVPPVGADRGFYKLKEVDLGETF